MCPRCRRWRAPARLRVGDSVDDDLMRSGAGGRHASGVGGGHGDTDAEVGVGMQWRGHPEAVERGADIAALAAVMVVMPATVLTVAPPLMVQASAAPVGTPDKRHSADAFGAVGIDQRVEDVRAERDGVVFVAVVLVPAMIEGASATALTMTLWLDVVVAVTPPVSRVVTASVSEKSASEWSGG